MFPASSPVINIEGGNNCMKYTYSKLAGTTMKEGEEEISCTYKSSSLVMHCICKNNFNVKCLNYFATGCS